MAVTLAALDIQTQRTMIQLLTKKHVSHACVPVDTQSYDRIIDLWNHYHTFHLTDIFKPYPTAQYIFDMIRESSVPISVIFSFCSASQSLCLLKRQTNASVTWVHLDLPRLQQMIRAAKARKRCYKPLCFVWVYT